MSKVNQISFYIVGIWTMNKNLWYVHGMGVPPEVCEQRTKNYGFSGDPFLLQACLPSLELSATWGGTLLFCEGAQAWIGGFRGSLTSSSNDLSNKENSLYYLHYQQKQFIKKEIS